MGGTRPGRRLRRWAPGQSKAAEGLIQLFVPYCGEVAEWLKAPVSKTGIPFWGIAGSNPALSAIKFDISVLNPAFDDRVIT